MKLNYLKTPGFFTLLLGVILLSGCNVINPAQPPRPTIVPANSTETPQPTDTPRPTATPAPPVDTPTSTPPPAESQPEESGGQTPTAVAQATTPTTTPVVAATEPPTATPPPTPTPAPALPPLETINLELIPVAGGFTKPTYLTHAGDGTGRLFVVEQAGRILVLKDGAVNPTPFLDIVSIVGSDANEQGLLSVAFHPNFPTDNRFFVNYTNRQGDTVIASYRLSGNPDVADPNSAKILMTIGQPYANHNGGQVAFGPDGYLYIGMGDGGAANDPENRAQDLGVLLGKILRIDIDNGDPYGVPDTNPFVDNSEARPEIWSYGWRNPWRFSFDTATNDLYVADVGQNQYEEIHVQWAGVGGQNYGWRLMEGFHCHIPNECDPAGQNLVLPVAEYDHSMGCSVTGGYVYRGAQFPALEGIYFYGDYCSGLIWGLRYQGNDNWANAQLLSSQQTISSFGQDEAGEVYLVDHQGDIFLVGN